MKKNFLIVAFANLCLLSAAWGWDDAVTHKDLTASAAIQSHLASANQDLLNAIGFTDGLNEVLLWPGEVCDDDIRKTKCSVLEWLKYGAEKEDAERYVTIDQSHRPLNHFHEPISNSGLNSILFNGISALTWAQDWDAQSQEIEGDQSWLTIRGLYYIALTHSDANVREETFAQVFKGLGHQMHLVQDMAVPYHVRNDPHPYDAIQGKTGLPISRLYFETWAKRNPTTIKNFSNAIFPDLAFDVAFPGVQCPVSQLWDANVYLNGSSPSTTNEQGLSEYTSANFFSEGTLFADEIGFQYLPYPKRSSTEPFLSPDGRYLSKQYDGEIINHFVRVGYFPQYEFYLDERCHRDYAEKLVPRAVGYSAALLNYFFRGKIELVPDVENGHGYVIENKTETEEPMSGSFEIYYDDIDGNRKQLWMDVLSIGSMSSGNNKSSNIEIVHPTDAKESGKYILVFNGDLGSEHTAVAGGIANLEEGEFVYVSMGQGSTGVTAKSFVWDIAKNDYAEINDSQGNPINFPCDPDLLEDWLDVHPSIDANKISWNNPFAIGPPGVDYEENFEQSCSSTPGFMCYYGRGSESFEDENCVPSQGFAGQEDCSYYSISYNCCGATGPYQHCQPNSDNPTWYSSDSSRIIKEKATVQALAAVDGNWGWYGPILGSHLGTYNGYAGYIINRMDYQSESSNIGSRTDTYDCSDWNMDEAHDYLAHKYTNHRFRTFLGDFGEINIKWDATEHLQNYNPVEGDYSWQYLDASYPMNYYSKIVGLVSDRSVVFVFLYQYRLRVLECSGPYCYLEPDYRETEPVLFTQAAAKSFDDTDSINPFSVKKSAALTNAISGMINEFFDTNGVPDIIPIYPLSGCRVEIRSQLN